MGSEEGALEKSGAELFKELLRVYPVAEVDDYFKHGQWKDEVMKVDLQLVEQHRKEAGAPDPVPLEEVQLPVMPKALAAPAWQMGAPGMVPGAVRPPMGGVTLPGAVRPAGTVVAPGGAAAAGAAAAAAGGPIAELRLIALFVAKWKLDPTKTKMMLAKMTPQKRRYVIQNFKSTPGAADATTELEQFIAQCEKTGAWEGTAAAGPVTPGALTGVKRPMMTPTVLDPSKRPHIMTVQPKAGAVVMPNQAWAGAGGKGMPGTVRPPNMMGAKGAMGMRPPQQQWQGKGW